MNPCLTPLGKMSQAARTWLGYLRRHLHPHLNRPRKALVRFGPAEGERRHGTLSNHLTRPLKERKRDWHLESGPIYV